MRHCATSTNSTVHLDAEYFPVLPVPSERELVLVLQWRDFVEVVGIPSNP